MNLSNYFWYFQSALPPRICDMIIQYGKTEKKREVTAITGGLGRDRDLKKKPLTKEELKDLKKKRNSNIVWMNDRWIYKEIQPYVSAANQNAGWNFFWDWSESCQFTKYKKVNIMIGIVIVGINLMQKKDQLKEKLENYQ